MTLGAQRQRDSVVGNRSVRGEAGFQVEYVPAGTNAEMQRNIQSGVEVGTLGYQSPAVMAEQNVSNIKIVAGVQSGGQNLIMRKGVELRVVEGPRRQEDRTTAGQLCRDPVHARGAGERGRRFQGQSDQHDRRGPAELQALKSGDLDGLVLWSPIIDRAVVEGYGYYPPCCDIG